MELIWQNITKNLIKMTIIIILIIIVMISMTSVALLIIGEQIARKYPTSKFAFWWRKHIIIDIGDQEF